MEAAQLSFVHVDLVLALGDHESVELVHCKVIVIVSFFKKAYGSLCVGGGVETNQFVRTSKVCLDRVNVLHLDGCGFRSNIQKGRCCERVVHSGVCLFANLRHCGAQTRGLLRCVG